MRKQKALENLLDFEKIYFNFNFHSNNFGNKGNYLDFIGFVENGVSIEVLLIDDDVYRIYGCI